MTQTPPGQAFNMNRNDETQLSDIQWRAAARPE